MIAPKADRENPVTWLMSVARTSYSGPLQGDHQHRHKPVAMATLEGTHKYLTDAAKRAHAISKGIRAKPWNTTSARTATDLKNDASQSSGTLVCNLLTTSIETPQPYKALSYTWGTEDKTSFLELSGAQLNITPSLYTALLHIASWQEVLHLWVDQVCIDQSNGDEKGDQVLLMADVYSKAQQTLVWLGPAADRSDELMDLWLYVGRRAEAMGFDGYFTKEKKHILLAVLDNHPVDDPLSEPYRQLVDETRLRFEDLMQAMADFDERPWFHRLWVVQEVSLCPDTVFVCGTKMVPVDFVRHASNVFTSALKHSRNSNRDQSFHNLLLQAQAHRIMPLLSTRRRRQNFAKGCGEGDGLFHLLRKLFVESETNATQNRDRIYGLLGLAVDAKQLDIKPDYISSEAGPIFTNAAREMIKKGRIELLSFSQFPKEHGLEGLATWAPDWRPNLASSFYTIFEFAEDHLFSASGSTSISLLPTDDEKVPDEKELAIRGYVVDTIEEVGTVWHASDNHVSYLRLFETIKEFCTKSAAKDEPIYENSLRRAEATWRVPVGDLYWTPELDNVRATKELVEDKYHDCVRLSEVIAGGKEVLTREEVHRLLAGRYRGNMSVMDGKRPYITRKGYLGMCPGLAIEGDVVVIFCGAKIPYVLKPQPEVDKYTFVGEAYCDGMMDGQILERGQEASFYIQ
ncbi:HET-domain-containing protein [Paraphaeosphaeria sporulosa]|uniref:HET-domain-containing protein n=1 Tax=Paraphaeosphaeria sporulosa TaxID=1460663 RepID=A0A177CP60_9PLEO|nr:HET-domain-containing protein [Paraphaeosphaeria sporulosa]OAG08698.1 HET-domain-containing protein [Paraphaeosphaeria sporulosa]